MPSLRDLQDAFSGHVRGGGSASLLPHLGDTDVPAEAMLEIHRNNFRLTLVEALVSLFPALEALVGGDCFAALAGEFVDRRPPSSPVLATYGASFPAFVGKHQALAKLPYLADVARLEWVLNTAFHAADALPLEANDLEAALTGCPDEIELTLHPAVRLIASPYPLSRIWRMARWPEETADDIDLGSGPEYVLVLRPHFDVAMHRVDFGTYALLAALHAGHAFADAARIAREESPDVHLESSLGRLIAWGAFNSLPIKSQGFTP